MKVEGVWKGDLTLIRIAAMLDGDDTVVQELEAAGLVKVGPGYLRLTAPGKERVRRLGNLSRDKLKEFATAGSMEAGVDVDYLKGELHGETRRQMTEERDRRRRRSRR